MTEFVIDLKDVYSPDDLHARIAQTIPVPEYYGKNLDALYDVLTEPEYGGECRIRFTGCDDLGEGMRRYLEAMKQMCGAAEEENPGLTILFEDR